MGTFMVEFSPETVKGLLLSTQVSFRWFGGFLLKCAMHSFVTSILGWFPGFDTFRYDSELDPFD
jgi:hypothetical protein